MTPAGRTKLRRFEERLQRAAVEASLRAADRLKRAAAAAAPNPEEEAELVSAGQAVDGNRSGQIVGTPEFGRFQKINGEIPVQQAIAQEEPEINVTAGKVTFSIGMANAINQVTGFYWDTRNRGRRGPSRPFNRAFLQTLEDGGVWYVTPRGTGWRYKSLEPEPGVFTQTMVKTLPPRKMYRNAYTGLRTQLREEAMAAMRRSLRRAI